MKSRTSTCPAADRCFHPHPGRCWPQRLVGAFLALLVAGAIQPAGAQVSWRGGPEAAPARRSQFELRQAIDRLARRDEVRHAVVHFDGPLDPARREELEGKGLEILNYLGGNAYFAALAPRVDSGRVAGIAGLIEIAAIERRHKLHPDLASNIVHPWTRVDPPGTRGADPDDPRVVLYVLFHEDVDDAGVESSLAARGGTVESRFRSTNGAVAVLRYSAIPGLADDDRVRWIEPALPALSPTNDSNRALVGVNTVNAPPYGLSGSGIDVLVYDGGKVQSHVDLAGRLTIGASDTDSFDSHATHVACTIAGSGAGSSGGQYRGMAPAAKIISYGHQGDNGGPLVVPGFLYTHPGDLMEDYAEAIYTYDADLANNSIGTNTAANGFPCSWEGDYGATDVEIDGIVRGSLGSPFRVVWSNGNERGPGTCGTTYYTTAPPACAKNHMTVGSVHSNSDIVTASSSWGPCDDGRLKPDVVAPGCQSNGDGGVTSCVGTTGYGVMCGTSMAAPTASGVAALLLERYRALSPGQPDFRNSTLRAVLAQTAQDLGNVGPDYQTGYGSIRAVPAVDLVTERRFLENAVAHGGSFSFAANVPAGAGPLKVTLVWDDPPGTPNTIPSLVNNLDLRVVGPTGTLHRPWTLNPQAPANPAVRTVANTRDNIEQVKIDSPIPGTYTVQVIGANVTTGPTQSFSLAWNFPLCGNGSIDPGEECDGFNLGGATCGDSGCGSGYPSCNASCQLDFSCCFECEGTNPIAHTDPPLCTGALGRCTDATTPFTQPEQAYDEDPYFSYAEGTFVHSNQDWISIGNTFTFEPGIVERGQIKVVFDDITTSGFGGDVALEYSLQPGDDPTWYPTGPDDFPTCTNVGIRYTCLSVVHENIDLGTLRVKVTGEPSRFPPTHGFGPHIGIVRLYDVEVVRLSSCTCSRTSECDDGYFCNGAELCTREICEQGAAPCVDCACNEATNTCNVASCPACPSTHDCGYNCVREWPWECTLHDTGDHGCWDGTHGYECPDGKTIHIKNCACGAAGNGPPPYPVCQNEDQSFVCQE